MTKQPHPSSVLDNNHSDPSGSIFPKVQRLMRRRSKTQFLRKIQKQKTSSLTLSRDLKHLSCRSFGLPNRFCLCSIRLVLFQISTQALTSTNFVMTHFSRHVCFSSTMLRGDQFQSNNTSVRTSQPTPFQNSLGNKGFTTRK